MRGLRDAWAPHLDETIPVYVDAKSPARRKYPANTVVVNYADKTVTKTDVSKDNDGNVTTTATPKPEMKGMSAVKAASARPAAIVVYTQRGGDPADGQGDLQLLQGAVQVSQGQ